MPAALFFCGSSRSGRETPLMRVCACGRTKGLSDRPLETFGAVPLMIGSEIARFFIKITLPINIQEQ
ncbi:MAG: hypothetical protein IJK29_11730, partial [Bacteroidales bacterium]|nr:hypothetical protein [Bacteroidales bacterium]